LELIRNFEFVKVDKSESPMILEEHLEIIEERLSAYEANQDNVIPWEQIRASIEMKR
jgi:Putative addiction module component